MSVRAEYVNGPLPPAAWFCEVNAPVMAERPDCTLWACIKPASDNATIHRTFTSLLLGLLAQI
jgi:hypothetical protein